ncbi:MAG: GNAT family N-acetyltransferase [Pseudomonadota bacterium]
MVEIIPFSKELRSHFYSINEEWISAMFTMEPIDEDVLKNPEQKILEPGGHIWFAHHSEYGVVGTCALRKTGDREYELTKMGVLKKARGLKAGEKLLQFVIDFVESNELGDCYLLTNSDCKAAIHLYEKNGFVHDDEIKSRYGCEYERCDVAMRLETKG